MELNEEKSQLTLTIRKCVMEDKGIYSCEILEFVKKEEVSYCDCIVDIQGKRSSNYKTNIELNVIIYLQIIQIM